MKQMSNTKKAVISVASGAVAACTTSYVGGYATTLLALIAAGAGQKKTAIAIELVGSFITTKKAYDAYTFVCGTVGSILDVETEPEVKDPEETEVC